LLVPLVTGFRISGEKETEMRKQLLLVTTVLMAFFVAGCNQIVVNSLEDMEDPPPGTVTLRSALASALPGRSIVFDPSLDGGTIELSIVGNEHTMLKGEVMGMREEPSGPVSYLVGYFPRDYGRSALYKRGYVVIDASALPNGITLAWTGGETNPARVLAVHGNLIMKNVTITGGWSVAEELPPPNQWNKYGQLSTRARGAGLAVWGVARLEDCKIYDNHCKRDASVPARSRDAGAFGGGIYADIVDMERCVVSGNSVTATGVSGGGVFTVGGAESGRTVSSIRESAITGNRISGIFAYGGGVYSDGGGIGKRKTLALTNSTIARNLVDQLSGLPPFMYRMGYWRGGGAYMSNGYMRIHGCTIVENQTHGTARIDDLGKPNLAGGIAATIGNAHAVEDMTIGHSVIVGNRVHETGGDTYDQDIFTGSLLYFRSMGYNRFGEMDFSQILVPVGERDWASLCRRHYPKQGDADGGVLEEVLDLNNGITHSDTIFSVGVDAGEPAVLHYQPQGAALDQVPISSYQIPETFAEYHLLEGAEDDFLSIVLARLEEHYDLPGFAGEFTAAFEEFLQSVDLEEEIPGLQPYTAPDGDPILTLADTLWFGPAETWPKLLKNYPYIHFWHALDAALLEHEITGMGPEVLGDNEWLALFDTGPLAENPYLTMVMWNRISYGFDLLHTDQVGTARPVQGLGDIGAIEAPLMALRPGSESTGRESAIPLGSRDSLDPTRIDR
jgi:hypothetical protein